MSQRLPTPGGDNGDWGDILNAFLEVSHNSDGTLANNSVGTTQLQSAAVTASQISLGAIGTDQLADGSVTNSKLDTPTQTAISNASSAISESTADSRYIQQSQLGVASGVAQLDTNSTIEASQLPVSVEQASAAYVSGAIIDLNTEYSIAPGDDITKALQDAITALVSSGGGTVEISAPGVYNISGSSQTGTVASAALTTTANGSQSLPASTITVASTTGFLSPGVLNTPQGVITYTGLTGTTFTGCSGGSGTLTNGATVAQAYNYAGQILFPALDFTTICCAVKIRGVVPPTTGVGSTGLASGVVLLSNATSGYVFDTVPDYGEWGWIWTGVQPMLENLIVRLPSNPQCGGINMMCALRAKLDRVQVDCTSAGTSPSGLTGALEAVVLPHLNNNGDVTIKDLSIRNIPYGVRISEHAVFNGNTEIIGCTSAFIGNAGTHLNDLGYCDIEDCTVIFTSDGNNSPIRITGHLDVQAPSGGMSLINDTHTLYFGKISISGTTSGGLGVIAGGNVLDVENTGLGFGGTWSRKHPYDNMVRAASLTSTTGAPGQTWPTLHPTRVGVGGFTANGSSIKGTASPSRGQFPALDAQANGRARCCILSATTGTGSYIVGSGLQIPYNSGNGVWTKLANGNLELTIGSESASATVELSSIASASTSYTLITELYYLLGAPWLVRVLLNGTPYITYVLSSANQTTLKASTDQPFLEDGYVLDDANSEITNYLIEDLQASEPPVYTFEATTARTALINEVTVCTSGTFTVTLPQPCVVLPNRIVNTGSGTITIAPPSGTLTNLSGSTGNITLAQGASVMIISPDGTNYQQIA